jgi:hypothetical protein
VIIPVSASYSYSKAICGVSVGVSSGDQLLRASNSLVGTDPVTVTVRPRPS